MTDYKRIISKIEMEKFERRLDILIQRKLIWRRNPITDIPTETFSWGWYYKEGTYENYSLFAHSGKIGTIHAFKWHLKVLWYLNPELSKKEFERLIKLMADARNGFVLHSFKKELTDYMLNSIYHTDLEKPPANNLRRVIFRDNHGLTLSEQRKIAGKYGNLGKGISPGELYEEMIRLNHQNTKISIKNLAENLNCTTRTVHRNLNDVLREEKKNLNLNLKQ